MNEGADLFSAPLFFLTLNYMLFSTFKFLLLQTIALIRKSVL